MLSSYPRLIASLWFTCLALALCGKAVAQGQETHEPGSWSFTVAPYLWAAGIEGDVGVGDREADLDVGFSDIRENLKFGAMVLAEARKDRLGFFFAPLFVRLGDDTNEGQFNLDVTSDVAVVGGGAFFRIAEWDLSRSGEASSRKAWIEPLAGARFTYIRAELNIDGPFGLDPDLDEHEEWIDPIIGASAGIELSRHWVLLVEGDIGGFGIGSDFTWNAIGLISYRTSLSGVSTQLSAGYRALSWDYDKDNFEWDVIMHGPVLGVGFQF